MMTNEEKKLYLLDAYALIYRSYYAFINNPRITTTGINTSATFGFFNFLLELLPVFDLSSTHILLIFISKDIKFENLRNISYICPEEREQNEHDVHLILLFLLLLSGKVRGDIVIIYII